MIANQEKFHCLGTVTSCLCWFSVPSRITRHVVKLVKIVILVKCSIGASSLKIADLLILNLHIDLHKCMKTQNILVIAYTLEVFCE